AQMPLWFVYSTEDTTVDSRDFSAATVRRLKDEEAENLHETVYEEISVNSARSRKKDKSKYDAHKCWIPLFRDECASNKLQLFDWLADQKLDKRDISVRDDEPDEDDEPKSRKDKKKEKEKDKDRKRDEDRPAPKDDDDWGITDTPPVVL
ncbi:MAG: hypothetical protein II837_10130, partial [Treponema sp.]|nr:hypothetical protein [Treponema sp.]